MRIKRLNELIETYKDFPKKGIDFKDVLGIMHEPEVFKELILKMSSSQIIKNAEAIISIDARGFIFGSAISLIALKPMIVARKPGKLPGELLEQNYSLEYGKNSLSIQKKHYKNINLSSLWMIYWLLAEQQIVFQIYLEVIIKILLDF